MQNEAYIVQGFRVGFFLQAMVSNDADVILY
ncbi:hypothetical protein NSE_0459 [Neorickettsia sennetsu str. Miyayama]|uniref:Uncharacterized protein n=1 Tax=Ehrlichia sennetsu (strain ATCC VR-367 / Miyayama) TaxID=222891 RepID=Q2GDV2_EHRS3|nr:hypothetical protein NSE_0459 [Neorickettsia sennetsu str. Miyayama]